MGYFGKIIKNTAIMFAVGILLALAAPAIASAFSLAIPAVPVLWNGLFFGGFGGIHAAVEPIINGLVSGRKHKHTLKHSINASPAIITVGHAPVIADEISTTSFQDKVAANRPVDGSFQDKVITSRAENAEHAV